MSGENIEDRKRRIAEVIEESRRWLIENVCDTIRIGFDGVGGEVEVGPIEACDECGDSVEVPPGLRAKIERALMDYMDIAAPDWKRGWGSWGDALLVLKDDRMHLDVFAHRRVVRIEPMNVRPVFLLDDEHPIIEGPVDDRKSHGRAPGLRP